MVIIMNQHEAGDPSDIILPRKLGDCLCAVYGVSPQHYTELVWRLGSSWLTPFVGPVIRFFSSGYFQADDDCVSCICECRRRSEVAEEIRSFRHSYLRRGIWRYLGVGLSGRRLLKAFDRVAIANAAQSTFAGILISENRPADNQPSRQP